MGRRQGAPVRSQLPALKFWRHNKETYNFEDYTIALSPEGRLVQSRTTPRAVPKVNDVIYTLIRWRDRWYVEYATASKTVGLDEDGKVFNGVAVGSDRVFSSAMKARAAANKHWMRSR